MLKWAFLFKICPVYVFVFFVVVGVVVNFSHFNLLFQNHWANFNQTWHKASLGEGDLSLFKWGPHPFPRGDNYEITKIRWKIKKIIFSRTTGPILTKLGTKHPWVKGIHVCSNEEPFNSHKDNDGFFSSLNQCYDIIICVKWFELFYQVNYVAHGPLVL